MEKLNVLIEKINQNSPLDFGTIFSESIELFKKTWVQGFIMVLLRIVFILPLYFILYIPLVVLGVMNPETLNTMDESSPLIFIGVGLFMLVFIFAVIVVSFALKAAFYRICKQKDLNTGATDDYLYFLKKPYLRKTITLGLITSGIVLLAMLLCFFPVIYVMVPIALINVIYAFNPDLTVSEIVKAGFALGNKKWIITFGLVVVASALSTVVGYLMCLIGVIVTSSFAYLPPYFVYKNTVGFEQKDDIDQIGTT